MTGGRPVGFEACAASELGFELIAGQSGVRPVAAPVTAERVEQSPQQNALVLCDQFAFARHQITPTASSRGTVAAQIFGGTPLPSIFCHPWAISS